MLITLKRGLPFTSEEVTTPVYPILTKTYRERAFDHRPLASSWISSRPTTLVGHSNEFETMRQQSATRRTGTLFDELSECSRWMRLRIEASFEA